MRKNLLFLLSFLLAAPGLFAQTSVSLSGTSYLETFDGIASGLPTGWSNFTAASPTSLGGVAAFSVGATAWNSTTGGFRNTASADIGSTATSTQQNAATDRALTVRQVGTSTTFPSSDPGAAFAVQLSNTTNYQNFQLSLKLQSLDPTSPRITTWAVQYGLGASPTSFNTIVTQPIGGTVTGFSNNTVTASFSGALDNVSQPVWIRVVALNASSGSGNRPTTGLDDFTLTYTPIAAGPLLSVSPVALSGLTYTVGGGPSAPASFTVSGSQLTPSTPVTVTPPTGFEVSTDNVTFAAAPLSLSPLGNGTLSQPVYTRLAAGLTAGTYSGTITAGSPEVTGSKGVAVSGTVYPAGATGPCGISTAISAIRVAGDGITFTATGRVTSSITTNIYIQDATGGILLYTGTGTTIEIPELSVGDEIQVTGILSTYQTDKELKNFTGCFVKTGATNVTPTSLTVTTATLCDHKGELVTLPGVSVPAGAAFAGATNYNLSDGTQLRIQAGTDLVGASRPTTTTDITGVVAVFNNICQLLPRSVADVPGAIVSVAACPEVGTGGSSISADNTLDITWWNIEWFGNTGFGPTNETQQQTNVGLQLQALNQDIFCLEEVCDVPKLDAQIALLNAATGKTYARTCGEVPGRTPPVYYSHWFDDPEVPGDATTYGQKVCFVYNTAIVTNVTASQVLAGGTLGGSSWASNRFPLLMNCDVTLNGITKNIKLVGLHAKSGSDNSSYSRRITDFTGLKNYLDATYPADNVLIMGDYNDDADQSIYVDAATSATVVSSFQNFVASPDYTVITKQLSNCRVSSTASFPDIIDHLTVSNEISTDGTTTPTSGISYIVNSVKVTRPIIGGTTTSDHFPVTARFQFINPLPVDFISFTGQATEKAIALNWATAWEEKNAGFDVLKGVNPASLEKVGYVAGHTTTTTKSVYEFTDSDVKEGQLYYYQLKQKDVDGTSTLSKIIAVRAGASTEESLPVVYPNPNPGSFTLSAKNLDVANIRLYNALGAEIPVNTSQSQRAGSYSIQATTPLPAGLYYLRVQMADGSYKKSVNILVR